MKESEILSPLPQRKCHDAAYLYMCQGGGMKEASSIKLRVE